MTALTDLPNRLIFSQIANAAFQDEQGADSAIELALDLLQSLADNETASAPTTVANVVYLLCVRRYAKYGRYSDKLFFEAIEYDWNITEGKPTHFRTLPNTAALALTAYKTRSAKPRLAFARLNAMINWLLPHTTGTALRALLEDKGYGTSLAGD